MNNVDNPALPTAYRLKAHLATVKNELKLAEILLAQTVPNAKNLIVSKTFEKTMRQVERLASELSEIVL